jgi:hypothetical protein
MKINNGYDALCQIPIKPTIIEHFEQPLYIVFAC